ncbi:MAG: metal-dependent hydrolase [Luteitalea sp.]|nr:metal-dependent hydrolase [Luteitalea sp.]
MWRKAWAASAIAILVTGTTSMVAVADREQARGRVQFVTYNIHHGTGNDDCEPPPPQTPPLPDCGYNLARIAETIDSFDADVVGLQEVDRFWARSALDDQPALLGAALNMQTCFGANLDHGPDSHSAMPHQFGTAILSAYPIVDCRNTLLPRPIGEQRGLLEALIDVEGTLVRVFTTHLDTRLESRSEQIPALIELIGMPPEPVILLGDFNARPEAAEMAPLFDHFDDVWLLAGAGPGFTFRAAVLIEPDRRIDYIFSSRNDVDVESAFVKIDDETRIASDHYPVQTRVRFVQP